MVLKETSSPSTIPTAIARSSFVGPGQKEACIGRCTDPALLISWPLSNQH